MESDPSGISNDRGVVKSIDDDTAILAVGPSMTPMHISADELPADAVEGTWLVLDMQLTPPMVLYIDRAMTAERT